MAFLRVQTGIYDPVLVGDKPKWYSRNLTAVPFNINEENSTLSQAVHSFNAKSKDAEQTPTGEKIFSCFFLIKFYDSNFR